MGHRAWWAYQCLPRNDRGQPPSFRSLEEEHGLTNNALSRLIGDENPHPRPERLERFAKALNCAPDWLYFGRGEPPATRWPIGPRPADYDKPKKRRKSAGIIATELDSVAGKGAFQGKAQKLIEGAGPRRRRASK